jgi:predicted choloylglycine hydrolase
VNIRFESCQPRLNFAVNHFRDATKMVREKDMDKKEIFEKLQKALLSCEDYDTPENRKKSQFFDAYRYFILENAIKLILAKAQL